MNVPFLSLLLLYTAVLQLAEVVGKRIRPALCRRKNGNAAEGCFVSTAFLHRLVDLKRPTTTTSVKPMGASSASSTITGPTTITPFSPPLTAPLTVATYIWPDSSSPQALDSAAVAGGGDVKHIRKSEEDEDGVFIPYTAANVADFPAYGKVP